MAGYIDIYDIIAKLPHVTISASSEPSITDVEDIIDQVEALMDARFNAAGIPIPIANADKVEVVEPIAINGVCAEVLREIDHDLEAATARQRLFDQAMANIEKHPDILRETSEVYSAPGGSSGKPRFHRDQRDW